MKLSAKWSSSSEKTLQTGGCDDLPEVLLTATQKLLDDAKSTTTSTPKAKKPNNCPEANKDAALVFDAEGSLVKNLEYKAGQNGIVRGAPVTTVKEVAPKAKRRRVEEGSRGIVVGFGCSLVEVEWGD